MEKYVPEVRVGKQGRLVIPAELRDQIGAEEGAVYVARVEDGALILESREAVLARLRALVAPARKGEASLVDELIRDRREAAARGD